MRHKKMYLGAGVVAAIIAAAALEPMPPVIGHNGQKYVVERKADNTRVALRGKLTGSKEFLDYGNDGLDAVRECTSTGWLIEEGICVQRQPTTLEKADYASIMAKYRASRD